jgi:hypothetical protein
MQTIDPTAWRDGGEIAGWTITGNPSAGTAWATKDTATYYGVEYTNVRQLISLLEDPPRRSWGVDNDSHIDGRHLTHAASKAVVEDIDTNVLPHIPQSFIDLMTDQHRASDRERMLEKFKEAIAAAIYAGQQIADLDSGDDYDAYPDQRDHYYKGKDADFAKLAELAELAELGGVVSPELSGADGAEEVEERGVDQPPTFHGEAIPKDILDTLRSALDDADEVFAMNDRGFADYTNEDRRKQEQRINRARLAVSDLGSPWRRAIVTMPKGYPNRMSLDEIADAEQRLARYLPNNYTGPFYEESEDYYYIEGKDRAGWTLDEYVIPRLASGLIFAEEVK